MSNSADPKKSKQVPKAIQGHTLFFTTSPRSILKTVDEIHLLKQYEGKEWTKEVQAEFYKQLCKQPFFESVSESKTPDLSARDRINRIPKMLGLVDLKPTIRITEPGQLLIDGFRVEDVLLRQMLKVQIPSPYHKAAKDNETSFFIKPYLEMIRLVRVLGKLSFKELQIFGIALTDYRDFEETVEKIKEYREKRARASNKKLFDEEYLIEETKKIYSQDIRSGNYKTRESDDVSLNKFLSVKTRNARDFADACVRHLRACGIISITNGVQSSLYVPEDRLAEVDYLLNTVSRVPDNVDDVESFKSVLFNPNLPQLYSDDKDNLINLIMSLGHFDIDILKTKTTMELLGLRDQLMSDKKAQIIQQEINELKTYDKCCEIVGLFNDIRETYEPPLMLEWNTWRAMTMIDDGVVSGNFIRDDEGNAKSTAQGNRPDIECIYPDYALTVEVTMQGGQKQYDAEGEPVARHLGAFKKSTNLPTYCLFIAPSINISTIQYFFGLSKISMAAHGGKAIIVPISIKTFTNMIINSCKSNKKGHKATHKDLEQLFMKSKEISESTDNENDWFQQITEYAENWMVTS